MTQRLNPKNVLWWSLSLVLLLLIIVPAASATTATPSECTASAIAARQAARLPVEAGRNVYERQFIELSKYLWRESGAAAVFYKRYRFHCRADRVPKYIRVKNGRVQIRVPL